MLARDGLVRDGGALCRYVQRLVDDVVDAALEAKLLPQDVGHLGELRQRALFVE